MVKGIANSIILIIFFVIALKVIRKKGSSEFRPVRTKFYGVSMLWVDGRFRESGAEIDTFFDKVVLIALSINKTRSNETTGVFIDAGRILTSNNAFKILSQNADARTQLLATYIRKRIIKIVEELKYLVEYVKINCARQVIPPDPNEKLPQDIQHGVHSPLHDLMVMRVDNNVNFLTPPYKRLHDFDHLEEVPWDDKYKGFIHTMGPALTEMAKKDDELTENLMFASIGHINDHHIATNWFLQKEEAFSDDKVVMDCDEWIPKYWGHFICIRNVNNYAGIASGGVLFSEDKLFGIGSFALFKGNDSILVFTDVRPYADLLNETCIDTDQNLVMQKILRTGDRT